MLIKQAPQLLEDPGLGTDTDLWTFNFQPQEPEDATSMIQL